MAMSPNVAPTTNQGQQEWSSTPAPPDGAPDDRGEGPSTPPSSTLQGKRELEKTHPEDWENGREVVQVPEESSAVQGQQIDDVAPQAEVDGEPHRSLPTTGDDNQAPMTPDHTTSVGDDRPPSDNVPPPTTSSSSRTAEGSTSPHLDLATYPTPELLKLLACLLQQIAQANDSLRPNNPTMTVDEVTGVTQSGGSSSSPTYTPPGPSRTASSEMGEMGPSPPRASASSAASAHLRSKFSVDSLVIPPFRPKKARSESSASDSQLPATTSTQSTPLPDPSLEPPPTSSAVARPVQSAAHSPYHHPAIFTASRHSISHPSSILCFHARNIPSISIEAYLQRILKYCPITNEVFLSLLVYFDRMSRTHVGSSVITDGRRDRGFAIDSYNVHRLVIAGITVASKFFSDVFYTNSRYAKVGGLPQSELNQLELQFLLLNDFRLVIPLEEMQKYADLLLVYWEGKQKAARSANGSTSSS